MCVEKLQGRELKQLALEVSSIVIQHEVQKSLKKHSMCKRVAQGKRCAGIRSGDFRYKNIWCDKLCTILYKEHSLRYNLLSGREGKFVIYRSSL